LAYLAAVISATQINNPLVDFIFSSFPFLKEITFEAAILSFLIMRIVPFIFTEICKYFDSKFKEFFRKKEIVKEDIDTLKNIKDLVKIIIENYKNIEEGVKGINNEIFTVGLLPISAFFKEEMIRYGINMQKYESILIELKN